MITIGIVNLAIVSFFAIAALCGIAAGWIRARRANPSRRSVFVAACLGGTVSGALLFATAHLVQCEHWGDAVAGVPIAIGVGATGGLLPGILDGLVLAFSTGVPPSAPIVIKPQKLRFGLQTLLLAVTSWCVVLAILKCCWPNWQPVFVGTVGALGGLVVHRSRNRNGVLGAACGLLLLLMLYPLSIGPAAVAIWGGWFSPYSFLLEGFYRPVIQAGASEPYRGVYEWYMCQWLNVDQDSLRFWTNEILER